MPDTTPDNIPEAPRYPISISEILKIAAATRAAIHQNLPADERPIAEAIFDLVVSTGIAIHEIRDALPSR